MSKVKIHRFRLWDVTNDEYKISRRWGTLEGIKKICGDVLPNTEIEVEEKFVGAEVEGLTVKDFVPNPREGFQTEVALS